MNKDQEQTLRRKLERLTRFLDGPDCILAREVLGLWIASWAFMGHDMQRAWGEWLVECARVHHGLCQRCDNTIFPPQHPKYCEQCDAKLDDEVADITRAD